MKKVVIGAIGVVASVFLAAQSVNPVAGTWELNVAKSKWTPGPLPKSQTRTYEVKGSQETSTQKGIDSDGKPTLVQFTASYDGKDHPYKGSPLWDSLALTKVDDYTVTFVQKKNGKVMANGTRNVSKDGKTMTIASKGTTPEGKPMEFLLVLEKR